MMKRAALALAALALAACATPVGGVSAPGGSSTIPLSSISLGDWRRASEGETLRAFQQGVNGRYGAGVPISTVARDLQRNQFVCGAAPPLDQGRGAPPAQVCRRTITQAGCTHTWQVHVFDTVGNGMLTHTRALYDRRCGGDGLLGGTG